MAERGADLARIMDQSGHRVHGRSSGTFAGRMPLRGTRAAGFCRGGMAVTGPNLEQAALVIADNVVSAVIRDVSSSLRDAPMARDAAVTAIMIELLRVMPTEDSNQLADACNRGLAKLEITGVAGPLVGAVDPDDGSVTMREA